MTIIRPTTINARFSQPVGLGGEKLWLCPTLGGDRLDLSGNGSHGTYYGGMGTVVDKRNGGTLAYRFENNLSKYIQVSNKENLDFIIRTNRFSISLWAYTPAGVNTTRRGYLGCGVGANDYGFSLQEFNSQGYKTRLIKQTPISPQVYSPDTRSTTAIPEEAWSHIAATVSDNEAKIYLNGVEVASQAGPFRTANTGMTSPLVIGKYTYNNGGNSTAAFAGRQDDIRIYNRTLSETEITHLASKRGVLGSPRQPYDPLKRTVVRVPAAIPAATKVGSIKKPTTIIKPSYQAGYARNASESENPKLWDGLVGAWMPSMGVTGKTLRDVSGNGNHASGGTVTQAGDWEATRNGLAKFFDGANDRLIINAAPTDLVDNGGAFSICALVKPDFTNETRMIIGNGNYSRFYIEAFTNGKIHWGIGGYQNAGTSQASYLAGNWHNYCVTYDGTSVAKGYLDGILSDTTQGVTNPVYGGTNLYIGQWQNNLRWKGNIASVSIYNRALSPTEIKQLYVDSLAPFRRKQRVSVAVPAAVPTPSATYHPLRSLAHPLEQ